MALVAYGASSDEDSEYEEDNATTVKVELLQPSKKAIPDSIGNAANSTPNNKYPEVINSTSNSSMAPAETVHDLKTTGLSLPKPKRPSEPTKLNEADFDEYVPPTFSTLPEPKKISTSESIIEEEDDEFLHKKAFPVESSTSGENLKSRPATRKGPVKIGVPSLLEFSDVDKDLKSTSKTDTISTQLKRCGLLDILPVAKSEQNFAKKPSAPTITVQPITESAEQTYRVMIPKKGSSLIPDTVRNRRPATNTEGVDGVKITPRNAKSQKSRKPEVKLLNCTDSENSEDEDATDTGDFFSLNVEETLPEVSNNEITAMVAKRAAKMAKINTTFLNTSRGVRDNEHEEGQQQPAEKRVYEEGLNEEAIQALEGSNAKRRRKHQPKIEVIELSSEKVLPNREEWMRTALTSATIYQPTGVLVDEEPVAGTRKKHQITYLAHKAKANEAELQAMWATNRQTRQQSQNKYGF